MFKCFILYIRIFFCILFLWSILYTVYLTIGNPLLTFTQLQSLVRGDGLQRTFISYDEIANSIPIALLAAEDDEFMLHGGFDITGIQDAFLYNQRHKRIHGASTISQQLAKNIFLWQGRSYLRKGIEIYFTILLESFLSKKRIITLYLNTVEFGKGIYGIEAASRYYYKKSALYLSRDEAIRLILCLPSPKKRSPFHLGKAATAYYNTVLITYQDLVHDPMVKQCLGK